jgi:hypothetical protein
VIPRLSITGALAVLATLIGASPAAASVTIGQVAPGTITSCSKNFDFLQASTQDNSYTLPTGVITSWAHRSQAGAGQQVTLKIFRKTGDPASYQAVGHDGPYPVTPNTLMSFSTNLQVKAGDVLGLTGAGGTVSIGCEFGGTGEVGSRSGNLADAGFGDFTVAANHRLNVSAQVDPSNSFAVGGLAQNKRKGTATLSLTLPNPGELTATGNGVSAASADGALISKVVPAGGAQLLIAAMGKKRKRLKAKGKVNLGVSITYTPTGGAPSSQSVSVQLKKRTKKK